MTEESLLAAALERPAGAERRAFLDDACRGDARLRDRVERLLAADECSHGILGPAAAAPAAGPPDMPVRDRRTAPSADPIRSTDQFCGSARPSGPTATEDLQATDSVDPFPLIVGPTSAPAVPGYAVLAEVARGGMGVVYRARQAGLNRDVALKMLLGHDAADDRGAIRFLAEAEAVAAVDHPHVVRVFEFGRHAGRPFLAMEYLPGGTLARRLRAGPRPTPAEGAALVRKLAAGVGAAHDLGIVHRDLKPGNVLFDAAGEPKVTDFGLAKRGGGGDLTRTNAVMGTPAYMSPEQARGDTRQAGPAADVWALGVILYESLTGRRPFDGQDSWEVLHAIQSADPVPPRAANPAVPRDLDLICRKCLAKDPRERYPTAGALADDLARFLAGRPVTARPAGPAERAYKWARRRPAVTGLSAAVLGLLAASLPAVTLLWLRAEAALGQADTARKDAEAAEKAAVRERTDAEQARDRTRDLLLRQYAASSARGLDEGDPVAALVWSAEGLKESAGDPDREREHRVRLANGLRQCWTLVGAWPISAYQDSAPTPDARTVLVCGDGVAQLLDVTTGRTVGGPWGARSGTAPDRGPAGGDRARPDPTVERAVLSPDGKFLAGHGRFPNPGYAVWDVRTGERVLAAAEATEVAVFDPAGRRVAFGERDRVVVYDLPGGRVAAEVTGLSGLPDQLVFDRTGDRLVVNYYTLGSASDWVVRAWDLKANRPLGADHRRVNKANFDPGTAAFDEKTGAPIFAWVEVAKNEVRVRNLTTGGEQVFAAPIDTDQQLRLHPTLQVLVAPAGRLPERLFQGRVRLSPDGARVVAVGSRGVHLWEVATGKRTGPPLRPAGDDLVDWTAEFDPGGGRVVAYRGGPDGGVSVWEVKHGRRLAQFRHPGGVQSHRFSPDGRLLLTAGKDATVRVWDVETERAVGWPLAHGRPVEWAGFAPDGRRVWAVCKRPFSGDNLCCVWDRPAGDEPRPVGPPAKGSAVSARFAGADHVVTHDFIHTGRFELRATVIATGQPARPSLTLSSGLAGYRARGGRWSPTPAAWNADLTRAAVVTNWQPWDNSMSAATRVELWDWTTGQGQRILLDEPKGMIKAAEFGARWNRLLTVYEDGKRGCRLELWDAMSGANVATLTPSPVAPDHRQKANDTEKFTATAAFFGRGGATVFAIGYTNRGPNGGGPSILSWDAEKGRFDGEHPFDRFLEPVALDPDGRLLVAADLSPSAYTSRASVVWDLTAGEPARLWSLAGAVTAAQFGPDGRLVTAVRSETGSVVRVWDAASGRPLTPAVTWANPVRQVAFDPAGGQVLVVSTGSLFRDGARSDWGEVQVLDAGTGQPLTPRLRAAREVLDARFTTDGRAVEAALASGSVVRWDCSPSDESPALLARLTAVQTGRELDPSGTPVPLPPDRLTAAVAALRAEWPDRSRPGPDAARGRR